MLEAFYHNEKAPEDQKIKNMDWAVMALSITTEYLLADYDLRFKNVVPMVTFEGERMHANCYSKTTTPTS